MADRRKVICPGFLHTQHLALRNKVCNLFDKWRYESAAISCGHTRTWPKQSWSSSHTWGTSNTILFVRTWLLCTSSSFMTIIFVSMVIIYWVREKAKLIADFHDYVAFRYKHLVSVRPIVTRLDDGNVSTCMCKNAGIYQMTLNHHLERASESTTNMLHTIGWKFLTTTKHVYVEPCFTFCTLSSTLSYAGKPSRELFSNRCE